MILFSKNLIGSPSKAELREILRLEEGVGNRARYFVSEWGSEDVLPTTAYKYAFQSKYASRKRNRKKKKSERKLTRDHMASTGVNIQEGVSHFTTLICRSISFIRATYAASGRSVSRTCGQIQ